MNSNDDFSSSDWHSEAINGHPWSWKRTSSDTDEGTSDRETNDHKLRLAELGDAGSVAYIA